MSVQEMIYQEQLDVQLKQCSAEIDKIKAKAHNAKGRDKIKYYDQLEDLRIKENAVRQKLGTLKEAGDEAREEQKVAVELAMNKLRDAFPKE